MLIDKMPKKPRVSVQVVPETVTAPPAPAPAPKPAAKPAPAAPEKAEPHADVAMTKAEFDAAALPPPPPPPPPPAPPAPPVPPTVLPAVTKARVLEKKMIFLGGHSVVLRPGQILDANHYRPGEFQAILDAVKTEPAG